MGRKIWASPGPGPAGRRGLWGILPRLGPIFDPRPARLGKKNPPAGSRDPNGGRWAERWTSPGPRVPRSREPIRQA